MDNRRTIYRRANRYRSPRTKDYGFRRAHIIIMGIIFFGISAFLLIAERPTFSDIEQRELSKMPEFSLKSYFSGDYTSDISRYFNDTVPFRDNFKNIRNNIMLLSGIRYNDMVVYPPIAPGTESPEPSIEAPSTVMPSPSIIIPSTPTPGATESPETSPTPPASTPNVSPIQSPSPYNPGDPGEDEVHFHQGVIIVKDRAMEFYGGKASAAANYAKNLNQYKIDMPNLNVYSMIIPLSSAYYLPSSYASRSQDQSKMINSINGQFNNIMPIDTYNVLLSHVNENIYFRTDHHWTGLGAYYAMQEFTRVAQVPFLSLSQYERVDIEGYVGSMYSFTSDAVLLNNPEVFTYYKPNTSYNVQYYDQNMNKVNRANSLFFKASSSRNLYATYLGTDQYITHVKTNVNNGRRLVIIKDSYGNPLPSFLTGSFEEIWVIDLRYFDVNLLNHMKNNNVTDLLFATCIFTATSESTVSKINTLRIQ